GFIVGHAPWQWVFAAAVPFAVVSLLLGRSLPDPVPQPGRPEWLSGIWSALTMLLLIGGLQLATHDDGTLGAPLAAAGVLSALLLVRRERKRRAPVVPVDLLARPVIGFSALAAISCFVASGALML